MALQLAQTTTDKKPEAKKADANILKYGDGKADGKKSLGGRGEMIRFELPDGVTRVSGIKIHGRYGYPQPPQENFEVSFVKDDFSGFSTRNWLRTACSTAAPRSGSP